MAHEQIAHGDSYTASADLSGQQFRAVKISGNSAIAAIAAITDVPVGVLQDTPKSGQAGFVAYAGVTKMVAGAAITAGALVGIDATGRAVAVVAGTDLTKYCIGQCKVGAAAAGNLCTVVLGVMVPGRAT